MLKSLKSGLRSGYHHHWKLMTLVSALVFVAMVLAFMEGWYVVAVALSLWFLMVLVQWITIDPPDVTDEDVHGPGARRPGADRSHTADSLTRLVPDETVQRFQDKQERTSSCGLTSASRDQDLERLAAELSKLLADSYTLYLKTHNFHWNVTGPMFQTLHLMFEQQYNELALAVDAVAERIRALGHPAPGTYSAFSRLATITETDGVPKATSS